MAHFRNCTLCGTQYDYCPRCDETQPTYLLKYCGQNCKDIFLVLNKLQFGHITKEEAADELNKLDLSKLDKFSVGAKKVIEDVMKTEKVIEEVASQAAEESIDPYEEIKSCPIEETPRRKQYKKIL